MEEEESRELTKAEQKEAQKWLDLEFKYIERRVKGESIQSISDKLKIHENQCIEWELKNRQEITENRFVKTEEILTKNKITRNDRINSFSKILQRINSEIETRDFKDVPTDKLILLGAKIQELMKVEIQDSTIKVKSHEELFSFHKRIDLTLE